MGYSGYHLDIGLTVDSHGGEREERGERKATEFTERLRQLCEEPYFNDDSITVHF